MGVLGKNQRARRSAEDRPLGMGEASGSNPDESIYVFRKVSIGNKIVCLVSVFFERSRRTGCIKEVQNDENQIRHKIIFSLPLGFFFVW